MPDSAKNAGREIDQFTEERRARATAKGAESSKNPDRVDHPATSEKIYDSDEIEFMMATEAWKAKVGRKYPTWSEHLAILKGLGYSKNGPAG